MDSKWIVLIFVVITYLFYMFYVYISINYSLYTSYFIPTVIFVGILIWFLYDSISRPKFDDSDFSDTRIIPIRKGEANLNSVGIGGLDAKFDQLFRRVFSSRTLDPETFEKLGGRHVKGVLLYGPPGTGKTLMATSLAKRLGCEEPIIVDSAALLNKWVGQSESNLRDVFKDAINDKSDKRLYMYIFDEFDSIGGKRMESDTNAGKLDAKMVNQLLSIMDGPTKLNNVIIVGITNRISSIDPALMRPGRFEVKIEIGLPDKSGRIEIFDVHTKRMKENDYLASDVDFSQLATLTNNYSGADIEGVINSVISTLIADKLPDDKNAKATQLDFINAIKEIGKK